MKTEINSENKAKFFAQYWGQMVGEGLNGKDDVHKAQSAFTDFLNLKPLSSISDDDAIEVGNILIDWGLINHEGDLETGKRFISGHLTRNNIDKIPSKIDQYLRSSGYALPWMGLSVEEMVNAGWIKILES